jgi:hypothetical protein
MKVAMNNTIIDPFYGRINYDLSEGEQKLNPNVDKYVKKSGSTSLENALKNNPLTNILQDKGKNYRFIKDYTQSVCFKFQGGMGIYNPCVEYKHYNYKIGDVINVKEFYGDKAKLPISEQNLAVPMSYLQEVPLSQSSSKENISFGKVNLTTNLKEEIEGRPNLSDPIGKYKVNKRTEIYKKNPNKKDPTGDVGNDIIGTLNAGDVVEVVELGGGGRGVIMTPYLIFNDGSYIIGYDADKVDNSTLLTSKGFIQKNKNYLLFVGAVVLGYLAYKKFKN